MAIQEVDALSTAMVATEMEIAGEAWGQDEAVLDESGDRSLEQMGEGLEGQHDEDDDESETESGEDEETSEEETAEETVEAKDEKADTQPDAKTEVKTEAKTDVKTEGKVPPGKHREVAERARTAEAALAAERSERETERATARKEMDELKAQMTGILAALQRPQQPAKTAEPQPEVVPDLFEDPKAFVDHLSKGFQSELSKRDQQMDALRVETSMQIAASRHGDSFSQAFAAVQKLDPRNPDDQMTVRRIYASPNPGEAMVAWHKRNVTLQEVGEDPVAYRQRIADETRKTLMADPEFRKQLLEDLRAEANGADNGKPRTITRLPKSLNGVTGNNSARDADPYQYDDSDQAVAESAWR